MEFNFNFSGPMDDGIWKFFSVIYGAVLLIGLLAGLAVHLMRAFGLYAIAKRRELDKPWLAWIPVANSWIIGSVSDQYRYLVKGEIKSKRKLLLGFSAANCVLGLSSLIVAAVEVGIIISSKESMSDGQMAYSLMGPVISVVIMSSIMGITKIVEYVLRQICKYDLYRSCDPGNAVAYLVLGILIPILEPIFLIVVRKKDNGLPPRRVAPFYDA